MGSKTNSTLSPRILLKASEYSRLLGIEQELKSLKLSNSTCMCKKSGQSGYYEVPESVDGRDLVGGGTGDRPIPVRKTVFVGQPTLNQQGDIEFLHQYGVNVMPMGSELNIPAHLNYGRNKHVQPKLVQRTWPELSNASLLRGSGESDFQVNPAPLPQPMDQSSPLLSETSEKSSEKSSEKPSSETVSQVSKSDGSGSFSVEKIVDKIRKAYKKRAQLLLSSLQNKGLINVNDTGHLVFNNKASCLTLYEAITLTFYSSTSKKIPEDITKWLNLLVSAGLDNYITNEAVSTYFLWYKI